MHKSHLLILFILVPIWNFAQITTLVSYFEDYGESFCSDHVELYSDSSFLFEWGCESRVAFVLGKFIKNNDTIYLQRAVLTEKLLIDSISYTYSNRKTDTVSISFFSVNLKKYISDVYISNQIESQLWLDSMKIPNENNLVWKFNRESDYFFKHGKHAEPSIYYKGWEYLKRTDSSLYLCLHNLALSTGVKKIIPIPHEAIEIRIYTRFPYNLVKNNHMYDFKKYGRQTYKEFTIKGQVFKLTDQ